VYCLRVGNAHIKGVEMNKSVYAILGTGPLGLWTANDLVHRIGFQEYIVRMGNRRGRRPAWLPAELQAAEKSGGLEWVAVDALSEERVSEFARGAKALVHCANPQYNEWEEKLPTMQANSMKAALANSATLVCADNLYSYEAPRGTIITESTPENPPSRKGAVRKQLHEMLRSAQTDHGLRWTTIQASDYFGPGASDQSHLGNRFFDPILAGKKAMFIGGKTMTHSWAYAPDFGRAMALVARSTDDSLFGRSWILPSVADCSAQSMTKVFYAELEKQGMLRPGSYQEPGVLPRFLLQFLGLFNPVIRELDEMRYQFTDDFVASGAAFVAATGFEASSLEAAVAETVGFQKGRR